MLRKVAADITPDYPGLKEFVADMFETLASSEGIGLAAPRGGAERAHWDLSTLMCSEDMPSIKRVPWAFINPHIIEFDDKSEKGHYGGRLPFTARYSRERHRPAHPRTRYQDEDFNEHDEWVRQPIWLA